MLDYKEDWVSVKCFSLYVIFIPEFYLVLLRFL